MQNTSRVYFEKDSQPYDNNKPFITRCPVKIVRFALRTSPNNVNMSVT